MIERAFSPVGPPNTLVFQPYLGTSFKGVEVKIKSTFNGPEDLAQAQESIRLAIVGSCGARCVASAIIETSEIPGQAGGSKLDFAWFECANDHCPLLVAAANGIDNHISPEILESSSDPRVPSDSL